MSDILKAELKPELSEVRLVRDVAPRKMMTLVSFQLTEEMIDRVDRKREGEGVKECENEEKRVCLEK